MNKLSPSDTHHLNAAQGWLGLGDWASANHELDEISLDSCTDHKVLQTRFQVYAAANLWAMAAEMARALTVLEPGNPFGWIDWAYSLYELNRIRDARNVLVSVVDKFRDEYLIRYSLACYACQLGELKEAFHWLEEAVQLASEKEVKQMVLNNPDLQPLWDKIGEV